VPRRRKYVRYLPFVRDLLPLYFFEQNFDRGGLLLVKFHAESRVEARNE
jgi:hypothetical protein